MEYDENEEIDDSEVCSVTDAHYIGDFAIRVFFSDGHQKLVDFKPFLEQRRHPSFEKYLNEKVFQTFEIVDGNLNWNDYEMIFHLEDLYENDILREGVSETVDA